MSKSATERTQKSALDVIRTLTLTTENALSINDVTLLNRLVRHAQTELNSDRNKDIDSAIRRAIYYTLNLDIHNVSTEDNVSIEQFCKKLKIKLIF